MSKKYGQVEEEKKFEESVVARDITKTIMDYGISQYQIVKIIYLLSLELENRKMADDIFAAVKAALDQDSENITEKIKLL